MLKKSYYLMQYTELVDTIERHGLKATANRISVLRTLERASNPLSLADICDVLESVDRSSVFRTLCNFISVQLVHEIDDGSKSIKYEICRGDHHDGHDDQHVHFRCERCMRTICLEDVPVPEITLPEGYEPHTVNFVIKGICQQCIDSE